MHILARRTTSCEYRPIPIEVKEQFSSTIQEAYASELTQWKKIIDLYGLIFPEEFLLCLTLMDQDGKNLIPHTLLISIDTKQPNEIEFSKITSLCMQTCDSFMSQWDQWMDESIKIKSEQEPQDLYLDLWTEEKADGITFFTKVTRENVALTLMADEILLREQIIEN